MPIVYPPTLPPPVSITDEPLERRRAYGRPGPWAVAAWGRERTGTVELQWVLTPAEAQAWRSWFADPVDDGGIAMGGAWWSATWPSVRGPDVEIAYQFLSEPRWEHAGRGIWRVSAQAQRRGGVAMPTADNAASAPPPPPPPPPPPAAPVADFSASPLSGVAPLVVNFTNLTTGAGPITYQWDFQNDGAFDSSAPTPTYTYNVPGTYAVRLQATNAQGSDVETKTAYITVNPPPSPVILQATFATNANDESSFSVAPTRTGPAVPVGASAPEPGTLQLGVTSNGLDTTVFTWTGAHLDRADRALTAELWTDSQSLQNSTSAPILSIGGIQVLWLNGSPRRLALRCGSQNFSDQYETPPGPIHVALVIPAGPFPTLRLYVNGVLALTYDCLQEADSANVFVQTDNNTFTRFWIDDLRIRVGDLYTANFTPPARGSLPPP